MDNALDTYGYILREHLSNCFSEKPIVNPAELNQEKFKVKGVFIASIIFMKNNLPIDGCKIVSSTNYWLRTSFANSNLLSSIIDNTDEGLINLIDDNLCDITDFETIHVPTLYETLLGIETGNERKGTKKSESKNYRNKLEMLNYIKN